MLASITDTVTEHVDAGGYPGLALLIAVENVLPPIPSEVVLPLAGSFVAEGSLSFVPAVLAATAGSLAGALVLYALARIGGRPLILRLSRVLRVDEEKLDRADRWFDRRGDAIVLLGRMVPGARSVVSIPAGLAEMPLGRFALLTAIGSGAWNAALIGAGWALGDSWTEVADVLSRASEVVLIGGGALVAALVVGAVWRRRRRQRREAADKARP
jgi:membrane protein DedA with SNARE-associated domain